MWASHWNDDPFVWTKTVDSSENQRDASIGDQFRICREFAQRQGWHIAAEYSDHAVSGATIMRPGFQAMMREALQKKVDIVMAEALDRFSRDQEEPASARLCPRKL